jgi:hypothetical protein
VTAAWRREGSPLVCAEIRVDRSGEITGHIKGTGDPRVTGEIVIKDMHTLESAMEAVSALLDAVSVSVPANLRMVPIQAEAKASVG